MKELTDDEIEKAAHETHPDEELATWGGRRNIFIKGAKFARDRQKEIDGQTISKLKQALVDDKFALEAFHELRPELGLDERAEYLGILLKSLNP